MKGTVTSDPSRRVKGPSAVASLGKGRAQSANRYTVLVRTRRVAGVSAPWGISSGMRSLVSPATQALMVARAASTAWAKSTTRIPAP